MTDDQIQAGGVVIYLLFLAAFLYWAFTSVPDETDTRQENPVTPILETAKAYVALIGSTATALLAVFTADTTAGRVLTVVAVIATAFATYRVPNQAPSHRRTEAGQLHWVVQALAATVLGLVLLTVLVKVVDTAAC